MAVLRPLELVIDNWPEGKVEQIDAPYWPEGMAGTGSRSVPFSGRLYIEQDDFAEHPPKGWHRLAPGAEVRLRHAHIVKCTSVDKDGDGNVVRLHAEIADTTKKVKGTLHWVSADHAVDAEVRLYDRLFTSEAPGSDGRDYKDDLNPDSLVVLTRQGRAEPRRRQARRSLPARAPGLLLRRSPGLEGTARRSSTARCSFATRGRRSRRARRQRSRRRQSPNRTKQIHVDAEPAAGSAGAQGRSWLVCR